MRKNKNVVKVSADTLSEHTITIYVDIDAKLRFRIFMGNALIALFRWVMRPAKVEVIYDDSGSR